MKWIGLTGGMGTGKSTVAAMIQTFGYNVLNADKNAHDALENTSPIFGEIVKVFSDKILDSNGQIDRKKLGSIVFSDKFLLTKLELIVHPYVQTQVQKQKFALQKSGVEVAFYDVPLLFEKRLEKRFDKIILVTCKRDLQIERAMERTKLSREEVLKRLENQMSEEKKMKLSDYVIRNDASIEELKMKVQDLLLKLKKDLKII